MSSVGFQIAIHSGDIVQIVTDYTIQRIGKVRECKEGYYIIIDPVDDSIVKRCMYSTEQEAKEDTGTYSVAWPVMVMFHTIKEIIILKHE